MKRRCAAVPYTVVVLANSSGTGCIPVYQKIVNTFAPAPAAPRGKGSGAFCIAGAH